MLLHLEQAVRRCRFRTFVQLTRQELTAIAIKAQSLWDRLDSGLDQELSDDPQVAHKAEARLVRWRNLIAGGDEALFQKRLAYDGLDLDVVRALMTENGRIPSSNDLPTWTRIIEEILTRTVEFSRLELVANAASPHSFLNEDVPIPFEEIFLPCILVARDRLVVACGDTYSLLTDIAHAAFERLLLQRLSAISSRILEVEFSTFIACLQFEGLSYKDVKANARSRKQYLKFIQTLYAGDLAPLFQQYCVWARMLAVRIDQWVHLTAEFLARLQADMSDIQELFYGGKTLGRVESANPGLSDSHAHGRTVVAITFESGLRLVYKPKDMGLEEAYFRFVDWLNEHGSPLPFGVLQILNRNLYGWVEYAEDRAMDSQAAAKRYFQRSGMLLCLMYIFDGTDFHSENVIARGEYPVPIDLETFFHHRVLYSKEVREFTSASREVLSNSVLRSHFLPNLYKMSGHVLDVSGLGAGPGQEEPMRLLKWRNINTDAMVFNYARVIPNPAKNSPRIGNSYLSPQDYVEDIVDGFGRMYRMVMEIRESLLSEGDLLFRLFQNRARFVFRGTSAYASLQSHAIHPDYQREGVDLSLRLDILSRSFLTMQTKSPLWPLIREEHKFLFEMDVPKFMAQGTSDSLTLDSGEVVQHCFSATACEQVKEKIRGLDEKDLVRQVGLITSALEIRTSSGTRLSTIDKSDHRDPDEVTLINKEEMVQAALTLAEKLRATADYSNEGEPSWVTLKIVSNTEQFMLDATDFSLYDGCSGIALFLSALESRVPNSGFRKMGYATVALMRRWLKTARPHEIARFGIGGYTGLGSVAYALVNMGELLDDNELLIEGNNAAHLIQENAIDADRNFDVLSGSAGAILGLLACHQRSREKGVLDRAIYCGRHLLNSRMNTKSGFRVWNTVGDTPLLGFAHGAAGIAYALMRLYQASEMTEFLAAAKEAIAYETDAFIERENDWPDLRGSKEVASTDVHRFMCGWCNGAAGIGLARIGALGIFDSQSIRNDIQTALQIIERTPLQTRDHLCCGNAGLAEILLTAGLKLGKPYWIQEALKLTSRVATRAKRKGAFQPGLFQNTFIPGLFQGAAGVGYHLLRLSDPQQRSSVLLLD